MIGQRFPILDWPYKEGLRIDEAMHDLTILVTGLYGKKLPNQNGAPLRLMVPWKYGFKSSKAIVNIKFADGEFDMQGSSLDGKEFIQQTTKQAAMVSQDVNLQDESQYSVRRLESNSSLQSFETIYLNACQRQVETAGYYEISRSDIIQGNFRVQIKSIIDHMGNLIDADILQSSGNSMLDALALRILYQSAPFEPFPEDMVANYQQLEIVRDWNFTNS